MPDSKLSWPKRSAVRGGRGADEKLRARGGDLGRQAADLHQQAVHEMGDMVAAAVAAGWEVRGRN